MLSDLEVEIYFRLDQNSKAASLSWMVKGTTRILYGEVNSNHFYTGIYENYPVSMGAVVTRLAAKAYHIRWAERTTFLLENLWSF